MQQWDAEIWGWLGMLGKTGRKQVEVVRDLLHHAAEDRMSAEDRVICKRALDLLEQQ